MVLGHSLKDRGAKAPLVAFILVDKLSSGSINELRVCPMPYYLFRLPLTPPDRL